MNEQKNFRLWGVRLLINVVSLYFSLYALDKWIYTLGEFWLILPTWMIFGYIMIILNVYIWLFDYHEKSEEEGNE